MPGDEAVLESFTGLNRPPQSAVRGVVSVGVHNRSSLLEMSGVFSIFGVFSESISPRGDRSAILQRGWELQFIKNQQRSQSGECFFSAGVPPAFGRHFVFSAIASLKT